MTLQMEPGTQRPLRPAVARLGLDSAFAVVQDAAPVNWTTNSLRLGNGGTLNIEEKFMDDEDRITANGVNVVLQDGLYEVQVELHVVNGASANDFSVAVTNLAGNVIYLESDVVEAPANADIVYKATAYALVQDSGGTGGINIRIRSEGVSALTVQPAHCGVVRRIGNADEANAS